LYIRRLCEVFFPCLSETGKEFTKAFQDHYGCMSGKAPYVMKRKFKQWLLTIRLFRIISIPSKFCYFRPPDHVISMELLALNFRCQCTQKLQSICAVLTFDPQLKKILTFSVKDISIKLFYLYQRLQCRDKYFFKIKFVFFLYLWLSASSKENDLPLCIYFRYQTDSGVSNTSIYSAVSLASPYYNYL
jgi:hypothetical protein